MDEMFYSSIAGPCNGAGTVVNSSVDGKLYCRCNEWYNGRADFFDSSLVHPTDPELSWTCTNYRPTEILFWGLVLVAVMYRWFTVARIFVARYEAFKRERGGHAFTYSDVFKVFYLRIMLVDLLLSVPLHVATSALKIAGFTIGTDISVTLTHLFGVGFFHYGASLLSRREFELLTAFLPHGLKVKLHKLYRKLFVGSILLYGVGVGAPSIAALPLDKTLGPWVNREFICILVRNLLGMAWCLCALLSNQMVYRQFRGEVSSTANERTTAALQTMKQGNIQLSRLYLLVCMLMVVFAIPYLWGYQTYSIAVMVLAGSRSHPGKVFQTNTTTTASNPSSKNQALSPKVDFQSLRDTNNPSFKSTGAMEMLPPARMTDLG